MHDQAYYFCRIVFTQRVTFKLTEAETIGTIVQSNLHIVL